MLCDWTSLSLFFFSCPDRCHVGGLVLLCAASHLVDLHSHPDSLSSPSSRDGSSHTEWFPISFVHAGSSKAFSAALVHCSACSSPELLSSRGVSSSQSSDRMLSRVYCLVPSFSVLTLRFLSPLSFLLMLLLFMLDHFIVLHQQNRCFSF